jgi:hypothetical protein
MTTDFRELKITNEAQLTDKIMKLGLRKAALGQEFREDIKEIYSMVHPANIVRSVIHGLSNEEVDKSDLKRTSLHIGMNYLIGKVFGRSSSLKGYFSSIMVEKLAGYIVKNHALEIMHSIDQFVSSSAQMLKMKKHRAN